MLSAEQLNELATVVGSRCDGGGVVTFAFVDDDLMKAHNERFCYRPYTTDVLAFPFEEDAVELAGVEEEEGYLGDVLICTDQALRQAPRSSHSYGAELTVLALHGLLHLLGFDHDLDDTMRRLEELLRPQILRRGGRPR